MEYKIKSERRTEIKKMLNNEFDERKKFLIVNLEINKNPELYLKNLEKEKQKHSKVMEEIDIYFTVDTKDED